MSTSSCLIIVQSRNTQGSSLRGKYCYISFNLTILLLSFLNLTPLTLYPTYLQHFLLPTHLFNNLFFQPHFYPYQSYDTLLSHHPQPPYSLQTLFHSLQTPHSFFIISMCFFISYLDMIPFLDHIMNHSTHVHLLVINPSYFIVVPQFVNCLSTPTIELLCLCLTLCNISANLLHPKTNSDLSIQN